MAQSSAVNPARICLVCRRFCGRQLVRIYEFDGTTGSTEQ
jgi:hypothetical protein